VLLLASLSHGSLISMRGVLTGAVSLGGYMIILRIAISSSIQSFAPSIFNGLKHRFEGSTVSLRQRAV